MYICACRTTAAAANMPAVRIWVWARGTAPASEITWATASIAAAPPTLWVTWPRSPPPPSIPSLTAITFFDFVVIITQEVFRNSENALLRYMLSVSWLWKKKDTLLTWHTSSPTLFFFFAFMLSRSQMLVVFTATGRSPSSSPSTTTNRIPLCVVTAAISSLSFLVVPSKVCSRLGPREDECIIHQIWIIIVYMSIYRNK